MCENTALKCSRVVNTFRNSMPSSIVKYTGCSEDHPISTSWVAKEYLLLDARLHDVTSQNTIFFIFVIIRPSNLTTIT
jgi:hypothetical protein